MNKLEFTLRLARESRRSPGQAADDVDKLVHEILKDLRRAKGQASPVKGAPPKGQAAAKQAKRQGESKQSRS